MVIDRTKNSIKGAVTGIINKSITIIGSFILQTIIVRLMGIEYAGLNSLFTSVLSVLSLAELGLGSAIVYSMYVPIAHGDKKEICALLQYFKKAYNVIGCIILVGGLIVLPFIKYFVHDSYPAEINLYILYILYLVHTVTAYFPPAYIQSIANAHQRRDIINLSITITRVIQYILQITVICIAHNYYLYALVFAFSSIMLNGIAAYITNKTFPQYKPSGEISEAKKTDIKKRVSALFGHELGGKIIISSDSIIISSILGVSILGIYSNYYYIFSSVVAIFDIIRMSLVAGIGNKIVLETKERIHSFYRVTNYIWIGVITVASACMICVFQDAITLWLGKKVLLPFNEVVVIVMYFYFWQFRTLGLTLKDAAGLWREDWYKPYLGIVLNIIGSILLTIITNSIIGVLIPTIAIMILIYFPIETNVIYKHIFKTSCKKYVLTIIYMFGIYGLSLFASYKLCMLIVTPVSILTLIVKMFISVCSSLLIFVLTTWLLPERKEAITFLNSIVKRYFKRA